MGSYSSVFSLQGLDAVCLIAGVLTNDLDAVIEATKLELLVQLDCKLVDFDIGWCRLCKDALDLDRDWGANCLTLGATEGQNHLIFFVVVGDHVLSHGKGNLNGNLALSFDFLFDRDAEDLNGNLVTGLLVGKSQRAATLPWPVGVVKNIKLNDLSHTWSDLEHLLGLAGAHSTSFLPTVLSLEVLPILWVGAPLHLLLELFRVLLGPFTPFAHLRLEFLHHLDEVRTAVLATSASVAATTSTTTTTATATTAMTSKVLHHLVDELHGIRLSVLALFLVFGICLFVEHGDHNIGSATVLFDLEEGMLVAESLLASGTVVEVLADGALVA